MPTPTAPSHGGAAWRRQVPRWIGRPPMFSIACCFFDRRWIGERQDGWRVVEDPRRIGRRCKGRVDIRRSTEIAPRKLPRPSRARRRRVVALEQKVAGGKTSWGAKPMGSALDLALGVARDGLALWAPWRPHR